MLLVLLLPTGDNVCPTLIQTAAQALHFQETVCIQWDKP